MRTPGFFYYDEWLDWCDCNASDGYHGFFLEDGEAQSPVSNCEYVTAVEEASTPVRLQQDAWCASVFAADIDPGPVMDFLPPPPPPVVGVPWRWRILGFRDSSDPSCDLGVTCSMGSDIWPPDTVVVISGKRVRSGVMCLLNLNCQWSSVRLPVVCRLHLLGMACGRQFGTGGGGWNVSTGGGLCLSLFDRFVPMHSAVSSPAFMSAHPGSEGYLLLGGQ